MRLLSCSHPGPRQRECPRFVRRPQYDDRIHALPSEFSAVQRPAERRTVTLDDLRSDDAVATSVLGHDDVRGQIQDDRHGGQAMPTRRREPWSPVGGTHVGRIDDRQSTGGEPALEGPTDGAERGARRKLIARVAGDGGPERIRGQDLVGGEQPRSERGLAGSGRADHEHDRGIGKPDLHHPPMMLHCRPSVVASRANRTVMPTNPSTAILWFRRDLRLHDQPALASAAADHDRLLPLFIVDPALVAGRFASPTRLWFMLEAVASLRAALRAVGSDLVVRIGDAREVVPAMARESGAGDVVVSRDHAPYGRARDRAVAAALAADGVRLHAKRGVLVHEPDELATGKGTPFSVYSPFRRAWEGRERRAIIAAPTGLPALPDIDLDLGPIPSLADLHLGDGSTADRTLLPEPSEAAARARLERWLARGVDGYAASRDRLDDLEGTSRLSADLRFGLLSPLEVVERVNGAGEGRRVFTNEVVWREFYAHVLFHRPTVLRHAYRAEFEHLPWSEDELALAAWRDGRTGYPIVDAGMRQLAASGWMHNRARMISASFLTKDLLIDWRAGEAHFMRELVDGDVASNNGGWQWSASTGTDPQPYFRIFNPILQGRRFDPEGAYVRRWVPELRSVPTARIHAPWEMTPDEQVAAGCRIGTDYPGPIVDHGQARARALAVYGAAREAARRTS